MRSDALGKTPLVYVALILSFSSIASISAFPISIAQSSPTTLLYADFTGSTLPDGWFLQGSAKFVGGLNASSGVGGIQLVNNNGQYGAVLYDSAFTTHIIKDMLLRRYHPADAFSTINGPGFLSYRVLCHRDRRSVVTACLLPRRTAINNSVGGGPSSHHNQVFG